MLFLILQVNFHTSNDFYDWPLLNHNSNCYLYRCTGKHVFVTHKRYTSLLVNQRFFSYRVLCLFLFTRSYTLCDTCIKIRPKNSCVSASALKSKMVGRKEKVYKKNRVGRDDDFSFF